MSGLYSVLLLTVSNLFMTFAWYGHLHLFKKMAWFAKLGLWGVILVSWGVALFEYIFQVPANRLALRQGYEPVAAVARRRKPPPGRSLPSRWVQ